MNLTYQSYMNSDIWNNKKNNILQKRAFCESPIHKGKKIKSTQVHHLYYNENNQYDGSEPDKQLEVLCDKCHNEIHDLLQLDPIVISKILESDMDMQNTLMKLKHDIYIFNRLININGLNYLFNKEGKKFYPYIYLYDALSIHFLNNDDINTPPKFIKIINNDKAMEQYHIDMLHLEKNKLFNNIINVCLFKSEDIEKGFNDFNDIFISVFKYIISANINNNNFIEANKNIYSEIGVDYIKYYREKQITKNKTIEKYEKYFEKIEKPQNINDLRRILKNNQFRFFDMHYYGAKKILKYKDINSKDLRTHKNIIKRQGKIKDYIGKTYFKKVFGKDFSIDNLMDERGVYSLRNFITASNSIVVNAIVLQLLNE